jgi:hypothetical protein
MRRVLGGALVVALVAAVSVASAASAARSSAAITGGAIDIYGTPNNGAAFKIVIVGAIGDYGTATSIDKNGKVDTNGDYVKIKLRMGTFEVNSVALNKKTDSAPPTIENKATCSFGFGGSGPVTLFNGTGAYAGISGTLDITETFAGVGPLYKTGAKKGQCNTSNNAQPAASWSAITGHGTVRFA